jgi:DNA-directed RNA polymerase specialized sigma24 family protein
LESAPPPNRLRFARWVAQEPALAGLRPTELRAVLLDRSGRIDYDRRDDLLAALVRLSRTDEKAHTVLVVCLLPGLRGVIKRHAWGLDHDEAASIALTALCERIWQYPLLRRPRKIAMNRLLDTAHDHIDARDRERNWQANTDLTDREIDRPIPQPGDWSPTLLWDAARKAGVLNDREITLIDATRVRDLDIADVATLLGMSHEAARKARQRAEHKLRAWWNPDSRQVA